MANKKTKGPVAEREVAKIIIPWWGIIEPDAKFVRTPLSGGWGDDDTRSGFMATGDLMTTSLTFPFDVEVKRREGWSEDTLVNGEPCPVWKWWQQTQRAARLSKREPMLWFRHNRKPWMVMLREQYVASLFCGTPVDSLPPTMCVQCLKGRDCACKQTRRGSGTLGRPLMKWGSELNRVQYGAAWPIVFWASELMKIHPLRFIIGSAQNPQECPADCRACGASLTRVRGQDEQYRRCSEQCGWTWEPQTGLR